MAEPFQAEYRIANVPEIGRECGVYLAFHDPDGRCSGAPGPGELQLELFDARGKSTVKVAGGTGDFIWYGFRDVHAAYQLHRSFFVPSTDEDYTVRVSWEPGPKLAPYKGFVYLECGGHK